MKKILLLIVLSLFMVSCRESSDFEKYYCGNSCLNDSDCKDGLVCVQGNDQYPNDLYCLPASCKSCGGAYECNIDFGSCSSSGCKDSTCQNTCSSNSDCNSGYCANTRNGMLCLPSQCGSCFSNDQTCNYFIDSCAFDYCN